MNMMISYSSTAHFLMASRIFINKAQEFEDRANSKSILDVDVLQCETEHKSYISSVVIQCASAIESATFEICHNGPGHHLGSNGIRASDRDFLIQFIDILDKLSAIERCKMILNLLKLEKIDYGSLPGQNISLLIEIRNELVHYKSIAVYPFEAENLKVKLKCKNLKISPFPGAKSIYFPNACLSADLGNWCLKNTVDYLDLLYKRLDAGNPLDSYKSKF